MANVKDNPKVATVTCRVEPKIKRQLEDIANADRRSISSLATILLEEALQARNSKETAEVA